MRAEGGKEAGVSNGDRDTIGHEPLAVANRIIELGRDDGRPKSMLEVIKLAYFAHGFHLVLLGRPLVGEPAQAWKYGPVFPTMYHEMKHHGAAPVVEPEVMYHYYDPAGIHVPEMPEVTDNDVRSRELIRAVWHVYKDLSGGQMIDLTHRPDSAWSQTFEKGMRHVPIPDHLIADEFRRHYLNDGGRVSA